MRSTLYDAPEVEYLDGRPYPKMSPKTRHGAVQSRLVLEIRRCAGSSGFAGTEVRFHPGPAGTKPTSFVPDVSFVSRERLAALSPEARQEPPFSPDIAVEVRSPSDDLTYLAKKIARYLQTGSVLVLDVDPAMRTVYAHTSEGVTEYHSGDRFAHDTAPWLHFDVHSIFADLDEFGL